MKLIIDIPEEDYNFVKKQVTDGITNPLKICIANGIPLDKIRAEITNIPITDTDGHSNNWYREPQAIINDVLLIIDKYKAGSEDEE